MNFFRNFFLLKVFLSLSITLLLSCSDRKGSEKLDTPTSGNISIACDESFAPIITAQIEAFENIYQNAKIGLSKVAEDNAFKLLIEDSVRVICVARKLNAEERKYFEEVKIKPSEIAVALEGVSLILHPENHDTLFTISILKDVFNGKVRTWSELNNGSNDDTIVIVFDNPNSSNYNFLKSKLGFTSDGIKFYGAGSNEAVIQYVSENKQALGVIGVNWISDADDPQRLSFLQSIQVAYVADTTDPGPEDYTQPFQYSLAQKKYPLSREVYLVSREARTGLGTGFVNYVSGEYGQRLFLMNGLLPVTMPIRIMEVKNENVY